MKLIAYDQQTKTVTVQITEWDLVDLNSLLLGVLNVRQDYTALGVTKERLRELKEELARILHSRLPERGTVDA
jgi:predicted N-acetyltransferase YhbS